MTITVLLTNGQLRKTLSATRSLGKKGIRIIVADKTRFTPAGFSKYCDISLVHPDPTSRELEFLNWLEQTILAHRCDVLFPMDDDVLQVVMKHPELRELCKIPVPGVDDMELCWDKFNAVQLAKNSNLPCPKTYCPDSVSELVELKHLEFPLIVKPRFSSGSRGIRKVYSFEELDITYRELSTNHPRPLIQECIPTGERFDVCLLYHPDGQVIASFVQKEVRHFPIEMGPSTVQESVNWPELVSACINLLKPLKWYGVIEVEFMVDPRDGIPKFMEINPRFWNSLELSVLSGVDFPWLLLQLALYGEANPTHDYEVGVVCKSLLPGDFLHFIFSKGRFHMRPPLLSGKRYNARDDILSADDIGPTFGFLLAVGRYFLDLKMWKMMFTR